MLQDKLMCDCFVVQKFIVYVTNKRKTLFKSSAIYGHSVFTEYEGYFNIMSVHTRTETRMFGGAVMNITNLNALENIFCQEALWEQVILITFIG